MTRRLLGLLIILGLPLAPVAAWPAEEPPSKESAGKGTGGGSPKKPDDLASESLLERERRLLRERVYGATPEERERLAEERRRLSEQAAAFGTDPTAVIGFYQIQHGHNAFTNGLRTDVATAVAQVPITPNWFVRATLPYLWSDPNQPRGSTQNGTSDTTVRTGGRLYSSENMAFFIGIDATFPTAAKTQLGTGKYTLGPGAGLAVPLPRARSLFFMVVQDFNSIGGNPGRPDIHFLQVQPAVNTIWSERWWTSVVGTWNVNWNDDRKTTLNLLGEVGHNFDNHWNVFAGAGAGVLGRDTPLGLDWRAEAGVRWVFRTPVFSETFFRGPFGR